MKKCEKDVSREGNTLSFLIQGEKKFYGKKSKHPCVGKAGPKQHASERKSSGRKGGAPGLLDLAEGCRRAKVGDRKPLQSFSFVSFMYSLINSFPHSAIHSFLD